MKVNHLLLIICLFISTNCFYSYGMNIDNLLLNLKEDLQNQKYASAVATIKQLREANNPRINEKWQKIVHYEFSQTWKNKYFLHNFLNGIIKPIITITDDQSLNKEILLDQLGNYFFVAAAEFFKIIYPALNAKLKNDYKKIIIDYIITGDKSGSEFWENYYTQDFIEQFLKPAFETEPSLYNDIFTAITTKYFDKQYPHDFQLIFSQNISKIINVFKIRDNFKSIYALIFLIDISKKNSKQANKALLKLYFDNLESITESDVLTTRSAGKDITFTKIVIDYLSYNVFVEYLAQHIDFLLKKNSDSVVNLLIILAHIEERIIQKSGVFSENFDKQFPNLKEQRKKISAAVTQNIMLLNNNPYMIDLFSDSASLLLKAISAEEILPIALSHIKKLNPQFAEFLLLKTQDPQLARAIIAENHFPDKLIILAKDMLWENSTPTAIHLKRYHLKLNLDNYYNLFRYDFELKNLYQNFRKKEQELNKQGYYTFVHGQMRRFYFPERLYTHLYGLRKHQSVDNFFFAHVKDLIETPEAQFTEEITRKTIHMAGTVQESESRKVEVERRKKVLFMNYAFFANAQNPGSNSAYYVIENQNATAGQAIEISAKEPFTLLGYDWIYKKHQQEIEQLAQDYNNLSAYGNMLLIAIPKDKIYKYVYLCKSGGLQQPLKKKDGTHIIDIRVAMETLLKDPESLVDSDRVEFCLIMTQQKGGLDPSTGIQIFPLLSGDPEKLKVLQAREKVLLDKITADVKEQERQQQLERAAKIAGHVAESVGAK